MSITLSVRLMTYNHSAYIRQAMESIMSQKTDFTFEVVVGDDFSTDGTLDIIRTFQDTDKIKIKILDRVRGDEYSQKRQQLGRLYNFSNILEHCTGKYIALLDGDDYWVDPLKLQKQVDFLEKHPEYIGCFGNAFYCYNDLEARDKLILTHSSKAYSQREIVQVNSVLTLNLVFRNVNINFSEGFYKQNIGDWVLSSILSSHGDIYYINEVWAAYRQHDNAVFSKQSEENKLRNFIKTHLYINDVTQGCYVDNLRPLIMQRFEWLLQNSLDKKGIYTLAIEMKTMLGVVPVQLYNQYQRQEKFNNNRLYIMLSKFKRKTKSFIKRVYSSLRPNKSINDKDKRFLEFKKQFSFKTGEGFVFNDENAVDYSVQLGMGVEFRNYCNLLVWSNADLRIGQSTFFNNFCSINCLGKIEIGENVLFGEGVKLYDHNHNYRSPNELITHQGINIGTIKIGNNVWIGSNVVILKDVEIGDNVVIGANCIIHKSIPSNSIVKMKAELIIEKLYQ